MKKKFYNFILISAVMLLSACTGQNNSIQTDVEQNNSTIEEKETTSKEENGQVEDSSEQVEENQQEEIDPLSQIDLSLKPNELGEIMILMYHGIGQEESVWQRTPDNFRKDLEYMYENKYSMISLNDYAKGDIKVKEGYTPIILTFDDGRQNNFNLIEENGELKIDPNCAVGILEEFKSKYPDFQVTASFFLGTNIFGQEEYKDYKLKWLIENGYDVGNHTYSHEEIATLDGNRIEKELGSIVKIVNQYVPEYAVETLALPHGSNPKDEYKNNMLSGSYEGTEYKNIAVLDVGWRPAYSPFDTMTDFTNLYRITASEINVDNCGIYDYFNQFEAGTRERFISDGNPDVVTIPKRHEEYLNMDLVEDRLVNIYEDNNI